jgi:hypothetical protein
MNNNELFYLWTAEKANTKALHGMWHDWICGQNCYVECTVPDVRTAKEYINARHIRECFYGGMASQLDRKYTSEEVERYSKLENKFRRMHLDMRDQIFTDDNGNKGLRDACGNVLIEPQFDDFPELYTCFERTYLIPVVINCRYFLYNIKEQQLLTKGYERIFRYFWAYIDYFVAVQNGKMGILDGNNGTESTPIDLDEVYSMQDPDGAIPVVKDGKIGFLWGDIYTQPIFDDASINSEEYTRVLLNGKWGWIDSDGKFTQKKSEASFGSWYDSEK